MKRSITAGLLTALLAVSNAAAQTCTGNPVAVQILGSGGPAFNAERASASYLLWVGQQARVLVDIGGARSKVILLLREPGALRSSFESYFFPRGAPTYPKTAIQLTTGDEVLRSTASLAQTIGMATIEAKALAEPQVRFLAIDGVAPTKGNLTSGAYKVSRPLYLTYPSDPQRMSPATRAFLEFARSPDGQAILRG